MTEHITNDQQPTDEPQPIASNIPSPIESRPDEDKAKELIKLGMDTSKVYGYYWIASGHNCYPGWQNFWGGYEQQYEAASELGSMDKWANRATEIRERGKEVIFFDLMVDSIPIDTGKTRLVTKQEQQIQNRRFGWRRVEAVKSVQREVQEPIIEYEQEPKMFTDDPQSPFYGEQAMRILYYMGKNSRVIIMLPKSVGAGIYGVIKSQPHLARYLMACALAKSLGETPEQALERNSPEGSMAHEASLEEWKSSGLVFNGREVHSAS